MRGAANANGKKPEAWVWPVDIHRYDCSEELSATEVRALATLRGDKKAPNGTSRWQAAFEDLERLITPIYYVLDYTGTNHAQTRQRTRDALLEEIHYRQSVYWSWSDDEWLEILCGRSPRMRNMNDFARRIERSHVAAVAYILCGFGSFDEVPKLWHKALAEKVFGKELLQSGSDRIRKELLAWGRGRYQLDKHTPRVVAYISLANRSPRLEDLTTERLREISERSIPRTLKSPLVIASRALATMGLISEPLSGSKPKFFRGQNSEFVEDCPTEWARWSGRWLETTTLSQKTRKGYHGLLLQTGRWLARTYPRITSPEQWTRELCAEYVAAVCRLRGGEWSDTARMSAERVGKPMKAHSKIHHLRAMSAFFRDCQEWDWLPRRFNPGHVFAIPSTLNSEIEDEPRVIEEGVWLKLIGAGLNLPEENIARSDSAISREVSFPYPYKMVRAMVMVLLFGGLRADEVRRLRVGCVRFQHEGVAIEGTGETLPEDAVCWLEIPVNKTGTAFTKPVDRVLGQAIRDWEAVRPRQPKGLDPKTGERVNYLFSNRGDGIGPSYLNSHLIPLLCREAGVPTNDAKGNITVHRARATIVSQLYNAEEPMSGPDLQNWLGHRSFTSTQRYIRITPTKLAKSYHDADYFRRNMRMIDVLVDQEAIKNGAAANGEPWKFYDLGHGYCTYDFYQQCPHRMACARCSFYVPKGSNREQILEGKANLLRMREEIPLTDDEVAAVEDGIELHEKLLERLADVPTPAGPTPRELDAGTQNDEPSSSGSGTSASKNVSLIPLESLRRKPHTGNGQQ